MSEILGLFQQIKDFCEEAKNCRNCALTDNKAFNGCPFHKMPYGWDIEEIGRAIDIVKEKND